jgi:excisionase family DNA binding protein
MAQEGGRMRDAAPVNVGAHEGAHIAGLGYVKFYELLMKGEIRSFKSGGRRLVPIAEIRAWTERKLAEQNCELAK